LLGKIVGTNAPWRYVLPTAVAGAVLGGYVAAAVAFAPDWAALLNGARILPEWRIGAAFSAFFVGLSLVTAAVRQRELSEFETKQRLLEARLQKLAARIARRLFSELRHSASMSPSRSSRWRAG
jgi:hypothetical protein